MARSRIVGNMLKSKGSTIEAPSGNVPDMTDKGLPFEGEMPEMGPGVGMMGAGGVGEDEGLGGPEKLFVDAVAGLIQLKDALVDKPDLQAQLAEIVSDLQGLESQLGGGEEALPGGPGLPGGLGRIAGVM